MHLHIEGVDSQCFFSFSGIKQSDSVIFIYMYLYIYVHICYIVFLYIKYIHILFHILLQNTVVIAYNGK